MPRKKGKPKKSKSVKRPKPFYAKDTGDESTPTKRKATKKPKGNKRVTRGAKRTTKKTKVKKSATKSKQRKAKVKKSSKKRVKKSAKVLRRKTGSKRKSSNPVRRKSVRKRGTGTKGKKTTKSKVRKVRRSSSKSSLTKKLDKQNVFKLKSGKSPSKRFNFILFESTTEISKEIVEDIITRAKMEDSKPLLQVRLKGRIKETNEERGFSTRMFPVYLDTLPQRRFYNSDSIDVDGVAEEIVFEVQQLESFYDVIVDSYEYFIMWG